MAPTTLRTLSELYQAQLTLLAESNHPLGYRNIERAISLRAEMFDRLSLAGGAELVSWMFMFSRNWDKALVNRPLEEACMREIKSALERILSQPAPEIADADPQLWPAFFARIRVWFLVALVRQAPKHSSWNPIFRDHASDLYA